MKLLKTTTKVNILLLLLAGTLLGSAPFLADAAKSTQDQINETENKKDNVQDKKDKNDQELAGLRTQHKKLNKTLNDLNAQMVATSEHLEALEQAIRVKEMEITQTQAALAAARTKEQWQYDCMEKRIQYSYEAGTAGYLDIFLGSDNVTDLLNKATYAESVAAYDNKMLDEIIANREYIQGEEARLEQENIELDQLKADAESEKELIMQLISSTKINVADYADLIEDAEKEAKEYEAELAKLEEDLKYLKKKLEEEIAMSQKAQKGVWRDISEVTFTADDRYLLASIIYCEAGGEPYDGKVAVGAVIINRVLSGCYPDTISGVVYQKGQFSPAKSGRLELALATGKATASCYQAADEAMSGITNVGTCVYFRTPKPGLTGISIGNHVFY